MEVVYNRSEVSKHTPGIDSQEEYFSRAVRRDGDPREDCDCVRPVAVFVEGGCGGSDDHVGELEE